MDKITMLGTGHAMTFQCFNTCCVYENENGKMLVDTGGGNQLLRQLQLAGVNTSEISAVFITHRHTDHIMGLPWLFRTIGGPGSSQKLTLYLHADVMKVAKGMLELLFPEKLDAIMDSVAFVEIAHGDETEILGRKFRFLDLNSPNVPQFGFSMTLGTGKRMVFHGDVPFDEVNRNEIQGADYLMHEAFNLASDKGGPGGMPPMGGGMPPVPGGMPPMGGGPMPGGPGGKGGPKMGHSTVREAAGYAASLGVKSLILMHGSDNGLDTRKQDYIAEARQEFAGEIYAPNDLDVIELI